MYYLAKFAYKYFFSQHIPVIARKQINKNAQEISALLFFFSHTSLPSFFFIFFIFLGFSKIARSKSADRCPRISHADALEKNVGDGARAQIREIKFRI